ncbi:MAG: hypothetical protein ACLGI8_07385 [Acidimicrobiia bacterium]|jgi:hypothetical protein
MPDPVELLRYTTSWLGTTVRRLGRDDRGEGVISAAIAVLIMAGIGALMWVGFKAMWQDTEDNTRDKVAEIGE